MEKIKNDLETAKENGGEYGEKSRKWLWAVRLNRIFVWALFFLLCYMDYQRMSAHMADRPQDSVGWILYPMNIVLIGVTVIPIISVFLYARPYYVERRERFPLLKSAGYGLKHFIPLIAPDAVKFVLMIVIAIPVAILATAILLFFGIFVWIILLPAFWAKVLIETHLLKKSYLTMVMDRDFAGGGGAEESAEG